MNIRHAVLGGLFALGAGLASTPASARAFVDIEIAPPPVREEIVPAPRHGYVWAQGYWNWNGHRHVWVAGHWVRARRGYHWIAPHWEQRGPRWHYEPGIWIRD